MVGSAAKSPAPCSIGRNRFPRSITPPAMFKSARRNWITPVRMPGTMQEKIPIAANCGSPPMRIPLIKRHRSSSIGSRSIRGSSSCPRTRIPISGRGMSSAPRRWRSGCCRWHASGGLRSRRAERISDTLFLPRIRVLEPATILSGCRESGRKD